MISIKKTHDFVFFLIFLSIFSVSAQTHKSPQHTAVAQLVFELNQEFLDDAIRSAADEKKSTNPTTSDTESITIELMDVEEPTLNSHDLTTTPSTDDFKLGNKKDWLFLVYIAGNNNLHKFVKLNLKSMSDVGSTKNMHVIAQIDELGRDEITRVHVTRKKVTVCQEYEASEEYMSGTQESLFNFAAWALENYPANKICLVLWNHGSGIIDPHMWDRNWFFDRDSDVFNFNGETGLFELRNPREAVAYNRGIAFNEEHSTYLTNRDLTEVLACIQDTLLNGRKIDILAFDACLMGMAEISMQVHQSVDFMTASQEIVPGNGLPYNTLLEPFVERTMSPEEFAFYITYCYATAYRDVFADFTQSALRLEHVRNLQNSLNYISIMLLDLIDSEYGDEIIDMLFAIRASRKMTTTFFNRDYIDLNHALYSIKDKVARFSKLEEIAEKVADLREAITETQIILRDLILSNVHGCNPINASGVSIYWPRTSVHSSYQNTVCGNSTQWRQFLQTYVAKVK